MPIEINRSVLGKAYPPFVVTAERGRIKDFARAIGDANPFHLNDEGGRVVRL
jgi:acyl dehydratase